jgi:CrcB protein
MTLLFWIGIGGFLGAIARYSISHWIHHYGISFPLGTLMVNLVGCFCIGFLSAGIEKYPEKIPATLRLFLITGILGALTTFSTFSYETLELLKKGKPFWAFLNITFNLFFGLLAVALGQACIR